MNVIVHYENSNPLSFYSADGFWYQGTYLKGKKSFSGREIQKELTVQIMDDFLKEANGFFNFVFQQNDMLFAVVDCIRSLPLFYSVLKTTFIISDSAEWIAEEIGKRDFDTVAIEEFKCTGYVTGEDTLIPEIKQIQAGEYIEVRKNKGSFVLIKKNYCMFTHTEYMMPCTRIEYTKNLDLVMDLCIDTLIKYAGGKQIVIPLSGGRDSRLIAIKLVSKGYKNILCYSYGSKQHQETVVSREVSEKLGLEWVFIPYNDIEVSNFLYNSEFGLGYFLSSHNYVSLPHQQDLFAVYELKRKNLVDNDCIFVPGHSGDFVAGSHIPSISFMRNLSNKVLVEAIYDKHYCLYCNFSGKMKREVRKRIAVNTESPLTSVEFADSYELQDWRNRQAKFIVNSVRVYDYCGFSWWLPFWDRRYFDFWRTVPLEYRYERNLYNEYVDLLSERYNIDVCRKKNTKWFYFARKIPLLRNLKRIKQSFVAKFTFCNKRLLKKKATCSCMKVFYTEEMMKKYCRHTNELNGVSVGLFFDLLAEKLKTKKKN